jgi:hypothetical protein
MLKDKSLTKIIAPPRMRAKGPLEEDVRHIVSMPMGTHKALAMLLKGEISPSHLGALLEDPDWAVCSRSAWTLGYGAAKGKDISDCVVALERGLSHRCEDMARACAYALANHYEGRDTPALESLKRHERVEVRTGAHLASLDKP